MAKKSSKDDKKKLDYISERKLLREQGPKSLYLMYGPEDYLREQFLIELKKICLPEGEDGFSFKRMDGPALDANELAQAIDSVPFMSERSFVELRNVDINKLPDPEVFVKIISDIPDYCTVVFVQSSGYEPDKRLKFIKALVDKGHAMNFVQQSQNQLFGWVSRRFEAAGKAVDFEAVQRLIFVSGDLMNHLIPEIEKVAAYAKGERVTVADVDAVAHHVADADVFAITDYISKKDYNSAVAVLSELLADKSNEPIMILAILGNQMRRLYAARLALDKGLDSAALAENLGIKYEFLARNLLNSARGYSLSQLKAAVELCADMDYQMKSSSVDDRELLKEAIIRIAAGG